MNDIAIDTNILIYAQFSGFAQHVRAKLAVESALRDEKTRLNFTVGIFQEFLHIVTDQRRFEHPLTMREATEAVAIHQGRQNVRILETSENDLMNAMALLQLHRLGRNRIADTILAAVLRRHGVRRLWTKNLSDFRLFDFLAVSDPTAEN